MSISVHVSVILEPWKQTCRCKSQTDRRETVKQMLKHRWTQKLFKLANNVDVKA